MAFGSNGAILRVDLPGGNDQRRDVRRGLLPPVPGGKALAAYHLLRDMPAGAGPLGPDNVLVLAAGLLTAPPFPPPPVQRDRPLPADGRLWRVRGWWLLGPGLRWRASTPSSSPAARQNRSRSGSGTARRDPRRPRVVGQDPPTVQAAIKEETGGKLCRVLQIGRAGENLVPYAMLMNKLRHCNGRTGMGAVMGSKNVRAIAVKGARKYADLAHDPAALGEIGRRLAKTIPDHPQGWDLRTKGAPGLTDGLNAAASCRRGTSGRARSSRWSRSAGTAFEAIRTGTRSSCTYAVRCKPETAFEGGTLQRRRHLRRAGTRRSPGSAGTAPSSTSSSSPGPTSCATRPGWTSSRPRAPAAS